MRVVFSACLIAASLLAAPAAFADCVNYSVTRAKAEQDAARRTPLTAAQLGVPTLNGLERNIEMIGDPRCGSLTAQGRRARFLIRSSYRDIIAAMHPNIRRVTERDGMGREWFRNPLVGDLIVLTSGTRLTFIGGRTVDRETTYSEVMIERTEPVGALTLDSQPYSVDDIVKWTPWVGGQRGNFVQVGGASGATAGANRATAPSQQSSSTTAASNAQGCPPAQSSAGNQNANVGAEIGGRVLGGGFGRDVGGAIGGLFGGGQQKQQPQQSNPNCPR